MCICFLNHLIQHIDDHDFLFILHEVFKNGPCRELGFSFVGSAWITGNPESATTTVAWC